MDDFKRLHDLDIFAKLFFLSKDGKIPGWWWRLAFEVNWRQTEVAIKEQLEPYG